MIKKLGGALAVIAVCGSPFAAVAACPELPKVAWWSNTVPEVTEAVATTYKGSWDAYIARWKQHRGELQTQYDNGGAVKIRSRNLVLVADELKDYIAKVDQRLAALDCLKRDNADGDLAAFGTAAGGPQPAEQAKPIQEAKPVQEAKIVEGQELLLEIAPVCNGEVPAFQVTNLGERWPRMAEVLIFRTDTDGKVTQRRVRMSNSQQMTFGVPETAARNIGEVAIFIEPAWYERKFEYDLRAKC
jgi:hypothetical protein